MKFQAQPDPLREQIVERLLEGKSTIWDIVAEFGISENIARKRIARYRRTQPWIPPLLRLPTGPVPGRKLDADEAGPEAGPPRPLESRTCLRCKQPFITREPRSVHRVCADCKKTPEWRVGDLSDPVYGVHA